MSVVTPTDFDIVLAARSMIRVYGDDAAAAEAARRVGADLAKGDIASCATWKRILAAIERVQADTPAPSEKVQ
jgi:hypothetical protein